MRTRSGLVLQPTIEEDESQETPAHAAAVAAAASNPRRRHGKAKVTSLSQPLVSWHRLPDYLQDNEFHRWALPPRPLDLAADRIQPVPHPQRDLQHLEPPPGLPGVPRAMLRDGSGREKGDSGSRSAPRPSVADLRLLRGGNVLPPGLVSLPPPGVPPLEPHSPRLAVRLRGNRGPNRHVVLSAGVLRLFLPPPLAEPLPLVHLDLRPRDHCREPHGLLPADTLQDPPSLVFTGLGGFGFVVVAHQAAMHFHIPMVQEALILDGLMGAFYLLGAALYATRVPERWSPGRFDLALNSHNVFHLCVSLAAYVHYEASLVFIRWRENETCP